MVTTPNGFIGEASINAKLPVLKLIIAMGSFVNHLIIRVNIDGASCLNTLKETLQVLQDCTNIRETSTHTMKEFLRTILKH